MLVCAEVQSSRFTSACFSSDGKLLSVLSGAPDFSLVVWQWEKGKSLALTKLAVPASRVTCGPDHSMFCCSGPMFETLGEGMARRERNGRKEEDALHDLDTVLISRSELLERLAGSEELEQKVPTIKLHEYSPRRNTFTPCLCR